MTTNEELKEEYGLTVQQVNALDKARADATKQERQKCIQFLQKVLSKYQRIEGGDFIASSALKEAIAILKEGLK